VSYGVLKEVLEHPGQSGRAQRRTGTVQDLLHDQAFLLGLYRAGLHRRPDDLLQTGPDRFRLDRPRVELGELEEVVHQGGERLHRPSHLARVAPNRGEVFHDPFVDGLHHGPQPCQRGPEVVRDRGDEVAAPALQRSLPDDGCLEPLGHVVEGRGQRVQLGAGVEAAGASLEVALGEAVRGGRQAIDGRPR
jgi:hypothetical protein